MGAARAAMNPNAQSAQFEQTLQNRINQIMPQINASFAGSGMTGSELHAQNLSAGVSSGVADVLNQNWQGNQNRALQAAGMVPGINQGAYGSLDFLSQMGQRGQQQNQAEISADILRNQEQQAAARNAIQDYLALTSGVGSMFGVQSSTQKGSPGLLGIAGLGLQAAPLIFSDARLKEDVKRVGKTDEGLGVYTYRYKGSPVRQMGVMAQEVEKAKPDAVRTVSGFKAVDYGKL
jgi:hypothetical protein